MIFQVHYEQNGGKCGVCGDPWHGPRENEPPGKYANGIIVRKYSVGQIMTVVVELTANHKGWIEFRLCQNDDPSRAVPQSCFDKNVLEIVETNSKRYTVPDKDGYTKIKLNLQLPDDIKCKDCVFQWKYNAGNSWGTDPVTGRGCIGCGNQEQFYGCADIAIGYDDIEIRPHKPLPADTDEDDDFDSNTPPMVTKWHRTTGPDHDIDEEWEKAAKEQLKQEQANMQTFSFMPVMNNGMNPCMCICKRSPLTMHGGSDNALEVKFFEALEGLDNQVCMCMCQNSSSRLNISVLTYIFASLLSIVFLYNNRRRLF